MAFFFKDDPIITQRRTGDQNDPFINLQENLIVDNNGKVKLTELPNQPDKVKVQDNGVDLYEIGGEIQNENQYVVQYNTGLVTFHPNKVGKQLYFDYWGTGIQYVPQSRIYTKTDNDGNVTETLEMLNQEVEQLEGVADGLATDIQNNEDIRQANESTRQSNEQSRIDAENTRESSEQTRISNENARESSETTRENQETTRQSQESSRVSAESSRSTSESTRQSQETTRESNEDTRISNENTRQTQESQRQTNTSQAISDAETATTNANDAATNAQTIADNTQYVEPYNSSTTYVKNNIVSYLGSSFISLQDGNVGNTPDPNADTVYWGVLAKSGEMSKAEYDTDANGQVDKADDADKLGGNLPSYYATAQSVTDADGKIGVLSNLTTSDKSDTVSAINEIDTQFTEARVDTDGVSHQTLKERLDDEHTEVTTRLADIAINIKTFGAKGDGVADDTQSFQDAINSNVYNFSDVVRIYIPAGIYNLSNQLTALNKKIIICGAGISLTTLRWKSDATSEGIKSTHDSDEQFVSVMGLTFETEKQATGTAIEIDRSNESVNGVVQDRLTPRASFNNILFKGASNPSTDGWRAGISLVDTMHINFDGLHFIGYTGADTTNPVSDSLIEVTSQYSSVEHNMINSWAFYCKQGVKITGNHEGFSINKTRFVATRHGVHWTSDAGDPGLYMTDCHISTFANGLELSKVTQFNIKGCLFYKRSDSTEDSESISVTDGTNGIITNSTYVNTSSYVLDAIVLKGNTNGCLVLDNNFQNVDKAIWFKSLTSGNIQSGNRFAGARTNLVDDSTENVKPIGALTNVSVSVSTSIPDQTLTPIPFDSVDSDEIGVTGTDTTKFTIPIGVNHVDITAGVVWTSNNTGERRLMIYKNGQPLPYSGRSLKTAQSNSFSSVNGQSLEVVNGDYIEVMVRQTSGVSLDLTGETFLSIRVSDREL